MDSFLNRNEYRRVIAPGLVRFYVQHEQTELLVCADSILDKQVKDAVIKLRRILDDYISENPKFLKSLVPIDADEGAHQVIKKMCAAANAAGVGPMAAVAGAFAECAGQEALKHSRRVIVENGGDIFMKTGEISTVAVYAGKSPLSMKIGINVDSREMPVSVCTSSGTVGPSKSFGRADAAAVVSNNACLADACATRLGNEIKSGRDIENALGAIMLIEGVTGAVAVVGDMCGAIGGISLSSL